MQALYRWFDAEGELLYVGISSTLWNRTKQHSQTAEWFTEISFCTVEWFDSRFEVENAENRAIMNENPKHNKTPQKQTNRSTLKVCPPSKNTQLVLNRLKQRVEHLEERIILQKTILDRQSLMTDHSRRMWQRLERIKNAQSK